MNPLLGPAGGFFTTAAVFGAMYFFMKSGDLARNGAVGIRTKATMSSDEAWRQGHLAGLPWVKAGTVAALASGLICVGLAVAGSGAGNVTMAVLMIGGFGSIIGCVIAAGVAANRAAAQAQADQAADEAAQP